MLSRRLFLSLAFGALAPQSQHAQTRMTRILRSRRPEDLEMPADGFTDYITPIDRFFVRSHVPAPKVNAAEWRLTVDGHLTNPLSLTLDELRRLPSVEVVGLLECAGNGRSFYQPRVAGLQWENGAVGNGRWRGVRLADVLNRSGLKAGAQHVLFDGADTPPGTMEDFQRSIPIRKALDGNTILAYSMNGETLPPQHGFPLRSVVPGWAGNTWVKWLTGIHVLDKEAQGFWMKSAYLHPGKPVAPGATVAAESMTPVTSLRVKSAIAAPAGNAVLDVGKPYVVRGAAWTGESGGRIAAVDVSVDNGRTWRPARFSSPATQYGWRLWEFAFTPSTERRYSILSRARDTSGDVQPMLQEWNPSGYLWNAIARVDVDAGQGANAAPAAAAESAATPAPAAFRERCLACHDDDVVRQQRLSRAQWDRELNKMVGWGARIEPADRQSLLDYLLQIAGPNR